METFRARAIGRVESPLVERARAPLQADEDAPAAWLVFDPAMREGLRSLRPGDEVVVVTWLDRADRDVLSVHPLGRRLKTGQWSTSQNRPTGLPCRLLL